jgi:hypothetical protein
VAFLAAPIMQRLALYALSFPSGRIALHFGIDILAPSVE